MTMAAPPQRTTPKAILEISIARAGTSPVGVEIRFKAGAREVGMIEVEVPRGESGKTVPVPESLDLETADTAAIVYSVNEARIGDDDPTILVWLKGRQRFWLLDMAELKFPVVLAYRDVPLHRPADELTVDLEQPADVAPERPQPLRFNWQGVSTLSPRWMREVRHQFDMLSPDGPVFEGKKLYKIDFADSQADQPQEQHQQQQQQQQPAANDDATYEVWFATNRKPALQQGQVVFLGERDTVTHLGRCEVFVPKSHKIGSIGSPWWKRTLAWTDDRLKLLSAEALQADAYWAAVRARLAALDPMLRHTVVLLHGFNVDFNDAALRAAQIGFDLQIRGPMMFFSWPAKGEVEDYTADEATIEASEGPIKRFLTDVVANSGDDPVHLIAHSMGNRALLRVVERIAADVRAAARKPFAQIVLAAPDVDRDVFLDLAKAYRDVAVRTTLYVSKKDLAVGASTWLHQWPRAGLFPPLTTVEGIDTVNVTDVDLTLLGHGYIASARAVLQDMHALIAQGTAPESRFGLRRATVDGVECWQIGG